MGLPLANIKSYTHDSEATIHQKPSNIKEWNHMVTSMPGQETMS